MHLDLWTLGLQTINALVLVWLLRRFLFGPLTAALAERRAVLDTAAADARAAEARAREAEADRDAATDAAARLKAQALAEARAALAEERDAVLAAARAEAEGLRRRAIAEQAEAERRAAAARERELVEDVLAMTARLMAEVPQAALDEACRARVAAWLADHPGSGAPTRLSLPAAPDASGIAAWRALIGEAEIIIRPDLVAGARLDVGGRQIAFDLRDRLDAIRQTLLART